MTLREIARVSCTNLKVYVGHACVYSPFKGSIKPFMDRKVTWLDSEDDILAVGVSEKGSEHDEKE